MTADGRDVSLESVLGKRLRRGGRETQHEGGRAQVQMLWRGLGAWVCACRSAHAACQAAAALPFSYSSRFGDSYLLASPAVGIATSESVSNDLGVLFDRSNLVLIFP